MNINGRYIEDSEALRRLNEIKTAISQTPFDHPLRPLFDFLTGYIDAQDEKVDEGKTAEKLLETAKETNAEYEVEVSQLERKLENHNGLDALLSLKL